MPSELGVPVGDLAFRLAQLALRFVPGRHERAHLLPHAIELGVGLAQGDPEGLVVERQQQIADLNFGVVLHMHLEDTTADLGGYLRDIGLDVGVLGADVAPAPEPKQQGCQDHQRRHHAE